LLIGVTKGNTSWVILLSTLMSPLWHSKTKASRLTSPSTSRKIIIRGSLITISRCFWWTCQAILFIYRPSFAFWTVFRTRWRRDLVCAMLFNRLALIQPRNCGGSTKWLENSRTKVRWKTGKLLLSLKLNASKQKFWQLHKCYARVKSSIVMSRPWGSKP